MVATPVTPRRPVRTHAVGIALVVAAIGGAVLWGTSAKALSTSQAVGAVVAERGDIIHVGHAGLVTAPVTVRGFGVPAGDAFDVGFSVCEPRPHAAVVGAVGDDQIASHCDSLEPVTRGTQLPVHAPGEVGPYLITTLTVRTSEVAVFCGFDLSYRSGWRLGRQEQVGAYRVVANGPQSAADTACR